MSSLYRKTLVSCVHCLHYFECNLPTDDKLYTRSYWCDRQRSDISRRNQRTEGCKSKRSMLNNLFVLYSHLLHIMVHCKFLFCFGVVLYEVLCCHVYPRFSALSVSPSLPPSPLSLCRPRSRFLSRARALFISIFSISSIYLFIHLFFVLSMFLSTYLFLPIANVILHGVYHTRFNLLFVYLSTSGNICQPNWIPQISK